MYIKHQKPITLVKWYSTCPPLAAIINDSQLQKVSYRSINSVLANKFTNVLTVN